MLWVVVACFAAGITVRRANPGAGYLLPVLDRWVMWFALPCLVLSKMSRAHVGSQVLVPAVASWCAMGLAVTFLVAAGRTLGWSRPTTGALLLVGVLGNTSFLGLAVVQWAIGSGVLASAVAYDQLGSFLALAVYGAFVVSLFGGASTDWRLVVVRIVRFVPFLALAASPAFAFLDPPSTVFDVLDAVALTVAPVAMFGLGLRFPSRLKARVPMLVALGVKMLVVPGMMMTVAWLWGKNGDPVWNAVVLQSAMPPMVTGGVLAVSAGFDEGLVSSTVGFGTLASIVSLPFWSLLVG